MIFLLPFRWRVWIYERRARREQQKWIRLRAKHPLKMLARIHPRRHKQLVTAQAI